MKSTKWINSAARRRNQAKFRRHLCRILCCPFDSCFTTGELLRDARRERDDAREWLDACNDMRQREGAWEDAGASS